MTDLAAISAEAVLSDIVSSLDVAIRYGPDIATDDPTSWMHVRTALASARLLLAAQRKGPPAPEPKAVTPEESGARQRAYAASREAWRERAPLIIADDIAGAELVVLQAREDRNT